MKSKFVALSIFEVANGMEEEVKEAFKNRPRFVENWKGFIKLEVVSPKENPKEIWLITFWENAESYHNWYKSDNHKLSHPFIPKGLKLNPDKTSIKYYDYISD